MAVARISEYFVLNTYLVIKLIHGINLRSTILYHIFHFRRTIYHFGIEKKNNDSLKPGPTSSTITVCYEEKRKII